MRIKKVKHYRPCYEPNIFDTISFVLLMLWQSAMYTVPFLSFFVLMSKGWLW